MPLTEEPPSQPSQELMLVLPRAWLQTQVLLARSALGGATLGSADSPTVQPWLAHGHLVLQSGWRQRLALVGPLRAGSPQPLPARSWIDPSTPANSHDGICLLMLAPPGATPPIGDTHWERWLHAHAPDFRLACSVPSPAVAALWLCQDGRAHAALREWGHWRTIERLQISGSQLAQMPLPWTATASAAHGAAVPTHSDHDPAIYGADRRDSRLAAALDPTVLTRLQGCRVAVVGAGRIGSIVAHGLVRLGVARLLVMDCDAMEPHNLDGDMPPHFEGRPKVEALSRFLRPLLRPGATVDARHLAISSPVAGSLLAQTELVIVCVDNDAARLWANAWALAGHSNLLVITTGQQGDAASGQRLAAAELRLLPAGTGCLACLGGFAQASTLLAQLQSPLPAATAADVRAQRPGSLRSWAGIAANLGLRMVEQLVSGAIDRALFRRLQETPDGGLQVHDSSLNARAPGHTCAFCTPLLGAGVAAVSPQRLQALAEQALARDNN